MATATQTPPETTAVARSPLSQLQELLERHKGQISNALPRHLTAERMIRVAMTAYSTTPALHECSVITIAACVVQASILGVEPNSVLGEAYLVPFNRNFKDASGKWQKVKDCQLIVGYQGLLKLVRQSGELLTVNAQSVRAKDEFEYEDGLDPFLRHKKADGSPDDRGPITYYWAAATLKGGGRQMVVMSQAEMMLHRNKYSKGWESQKEKSTWGVEAEAMGLKTVLRKLCKLLPKSIEKDNVSAAVNLDERAESGMAQRYSIDVPLVFHQPVDEEATDESDPSRAANGMPMRASEVAKDGNPDDIAAKQRAARKAALEAMPDLPEFPVVANTKMGDACRVQGKYYMHGPEKCWVEHPDAAEILKG